MSTALRAFEAEVRDALAEHWLPVVRHADALDQAEAASADACQQSLLRFVTEAWPILEPEHPFVPNWHIEAICRHLEAAALGRIPRLLLNVPPGTMKSLLVSVFFPAWEWIGHPDLRYLCASYGQELATRDNRRCRDLVQSDWYQHRWPHVQLREDQNQKTRYDTTKGGWRIGTSVGGRGTGEHPDRVIIDDPHSAKQAESETERRTALEWFDRTIAPRGVARGARQIVIMQRLHQADLSGHLLDQAGASAWCHICLPMRAETDRMVATPLGWTDPRSSGDLLWPALYSEARVRKLELDLGSAVAAGQLQQRPTPAGGGLFRREWFSVVEAMPTGRLTRCRGWDCAATKGGGDYTVGARVSRDPATGRIYVEHVVRGQWSAGAVDTLIQQTARADGDSVIVREEQEGGSAGKAVIEARTKALAGFIYSGVPSTGDKVTRARPFAVQAEAGNVVLVRGEWNQEWLDEVAVFPFGAHDDQVDATAAAFMEISLGWDNASTGYPVEIAEPSLWSTFGGGGSNAKPGVSDWSGLGGG